MTTQERSHFEDLIWTFNREMRPYYVVAFPLRWFWQDTRNYFRTLFRRRVAWVRNWQAVPMIVDSKPKWVLVYERRRFLRWVPVQAAVVDTLDECFTLVEHRHKAPMQLGVGENGKASGTMTLGLRFNCKVSDDAPDEFRPEGTAAGAAPTGGDGEVHAQPPEAARDGQAQGGEAPQDPARPSREDRAAEEITSEVSGHGSPVLERRE